MRICIVGGGSYTWALGFVRQFIRSNRLGQLDVILMDVNAEALRLVKRAADLLNSQAGNPISIAATGDLDDALSGADFVLVSISTGGLDAMSHDLEIPDRYGIRHTVGDTVGPGGLLRAVRNIPVLHGIAERVSQLCPRAWFINLTNPLTVLTRVPHKAFGIRTLGMCPGLEAQARMLADLAGLPRDSRLDYAATGIDHGSWFTSLFGDGQDVLQRLKEAGYYRSDGRLPTSPMIHDPMSHSVGSRAVFALWREFGFMPGINDRHHVENHPWFLCGSGELPFELERTTIAQRREGMAHRKSLLEAFVASGSVGDLGGLGHGDDPVLEVIESLSGFRSFLYGSNYMNVGQIPDAPLGAVVETRCHFDAAGVHPLCSPMPPLLKAMVLPHIHRQEAVIDIAMDGSFDELVAMVMTDPLCARLRVNEGRTMVREMLEANRPLIANHRLLEFT